MASYATVDDVENGFKTLDTDQKTRAAALLEEASIIIDAYNSGASTDAKKVVACRMVRRAIQDEDNTIFPMGSTQGSMTAGSYSQSWTMTNGSAGELYLSKLEKKLLGFGDRIGMSNPYEGLTND